MNNFDLHTPTRILFGKGAIADLRGQIPTGARVLITYGGGSVKKNGVLDQVYSALEGLDILEFSGIEPNPTYETLMKAVKIVREENVTFLLAVGGGSVLDGTKFIAAAANYADGIDPWHILQTGGSEIKSAIPMGSVLTLPATGSESNAGAVVSRKATGDKQAFHSAFVQPVFAVLDPVYTYTLPPRQVANGVVDAFVHTVEQYVTYPVNGKIQDRFAEGILLTLIEEGPKALQEPENYDVRANVMWAATQALNGLIGAGVPQDWATHMLGHELTAMHGLDHAQTLAIVLPALWNEKMQAWLGLSTEGNYRNGCMQDIHWTDGGFGYFPSYTLGAMYAAQLFHAARVALPTLDEAIAQGDFSALFDWLRQNIWQHGSRFTTSQLIQHATGEDLNSDFFRQHLTSRYL